MIIPEIIIADLLRNELNKLAKNPRLLRPFLQSLSQKNAQLFVEDFIKSNFYTRIVTSYPRDNPQLPLIVILLQSDEETHPVLGNVLGYGKTTEQLRIPDAFGYQVGQGTNTYPPGGGDTLVGEPPKTVDLDSTSFKTALGGGFSKSISIECFMHHPETTVIMYYILKSIALKNRSFLELNGLSCVTLSGGDLIQDNQSEPDFVFMRALHLNMVVFEYYVSDDDDTYNTIPEFKHISILLEADPNLTQWKESHTYISTYAKPIIDLVTPATITAGTTIDIHARVRNFTNDVEASLDNIGYMANFINGITVNSATMTNFSFAQIWKSTQVAVGSSSTTAYVGDSADTVPTSVKTDMYIKFIKSGDIVNNKLRVITSVTTGAGGRIEFYPALEDDCLGAYVEVYSMSLLFDINITAAANATKAPRDLFLQDEQGYTAVLSQAITVV